MTNLFLVFWDTCFCFISFPDSAPVVELLEQVESRLPKEAPES